MSNLQETPRTSRVDRKRKFAEAAENRVPTPYANLEKDGPKCSNKDKVRVPTPYPHLDKNRSKITNNFIEPPALSSPPLRKKATAIYRKSGGLNALKQYSSPPITPAAIAASPSLLAVAITASPKQLSLSSTNGGLETLKNECNGYVDGMIERIIEHMEDKRNNLLDEITVIFRDVFGGKFIETFEDEIKSESDDGEGESGVAGKDSKSKDGGHQKMLIEEIYDSGDDSWGSGVDASGDAKVIEIFEDEVESKSHDEEMEKDTASKTDNEKEKNGVQNFLDDLSFEA